MRIGIDSRPFQGQLAGTGRYVLELCRALDQWLPEAEFFLYGNEPYELPLTSYRWKKSFDESILFDRLPASIWYLERVGRLARRDGIDIFWGSANFLPKGVGRNSGACASVLTVLDLVPDLYPETMNWKHQLAYHLYFEQSLKNADRLVTISYGSKDRLERKYAKPCDAVVYPCAGEAFKSPSVDLIRKVRDRYGLQSNFLLTVATLEPRKNLGNLLKAMIQLKSERGIVVPDLVLVGQVGWKAQVLLELITSARAAGIKVLQTGFVPDEDLPALYAASSAFVFPSIYEGFGMPVLEALKCGAYVLASDIPEIREAGGEYPKYFEPSLTGIANALREFLLSDDYLYPDHARFNRVINQGSTWNEEGRKLAMVMKSLL